ncbi:MAG: tRNA dimethylallyltransferase [Verrucomicrobiae bacterium]|nr:tRNA dimethylallyltransferase [Verrucomicrobiae bacterium]
MTPVFLVGPTASGKTAVAHALGRPVISADSMQVYRGMDIGTAKDKAAQLVDICDITEAFDVKRFVELATPLLPGAVVCGGTGLYIRALRQGIFDGPVRDTALRTRLEALPAAALFAELERLDPKAAATIDRHNPRRLVRALEVFHTTGKSIRDFQTQTSSGGLIFGLHRDRQDLIQRIEQRIEEQMRAGWLDEVRQLMAKGIEQNPVAMQAAGYRELVAHLRGKLSLPEAVALIKIRTRQLAKRQMTWFRREPGLQWLTVAVDEAPAATAAKILEKLPSH